jgi:hypothetical protein
LPGVLAGALRDQAEAVNRDLDADRPRLALAGVRVPRLALDGVDLPREGVEARPLADLREEVQFVVRRALRDHVLDERQAVLEVRHRDPRPARRL